MLKVADLEHMDPSQDVHGHEECMASYGLTALTSLGLARYRFQGN